MSDIFNLLQAKGYCTANDLISESLETPYTGPVIVTPGYQIQSGYEKPEGILLSKATYPDIPGFIGMRILGSKAYTLTSDPKDIYSHQGLLLRETQAFVSAVWSMRDKEIIKISEETMYKMFPYHLSRGGL